MPRAARQAPGGHFETFGGLNERSQSCRPYDQSLFHSAEKLAIPIPAWRDNMDSRPITNTADWRRYEIVLDVPQSATSIAFGFFLWGSGTVWADDFKLERVDASVPRTVGDNGARLDEPRNLNFDRK
jgi:hypothetical protein